MKIPKIFKKKFSEKKFAKNILANINDPKDVEFIENLFIKNENNNLVLKNDLTDEEIKKLKKIKKIIKSNKGGLRKGRLITLGIIVLFIILFNIFLKNKIVEKSIEKGLEISFKAKSDIKNVDFKIFSGRLRFDKLTVANKNKPMRNLFELGETDINIDISQLLRKKFIIENFKTDNLEWDTKRKISGRLIKRKEKAESKKSKTQKAADSFKDDITTILKNYKNQLRSPKVVANMNEEIKNINQKWKDDINNFKQNIDNLEKTYRKVKEINLEKLEKKEDIQETLTTINRFQKSITKTKENFDRINNNFKKDSNFISNSKDQIESAYKNDINFVKSKLTLPGGSNNSILTNILKDYIKQKLGKFQNYTYLLKQAIEKDKKPAEEKNKIAKNNRMGYNVPFKAINYPKFWLQNFNFSLIDQKSSKNLSLKVEDLTDNHSVINNATEFSFFQKERNNILNLEGYFDTRKTSKNKLYLTLTTKNYPFSISEEIENQYFKEIKGNYNLDMIYKQSNETAKKEGTINLILSNIIINSKNNQTGKIIKSILENTENILIKISYQIENSNIKLKLNSDIDRKISNSIKQYAQKELSKYEKQIKETLQQRLDKELNRNKELIFRFKNLDKTLDNNEKKMNSYSEYTEKIKKEATKKLGGNLIDKLKNIFK